MPQHRLRRHRAQRKLQATRQHRHRYLLRIGRCQDEFQIFGRLFQRLEHGIESRVRQHVHFVDHEDLEAPLHGLVNGLLQQALNFIDAPVGGGIELGVIDKTPRINGAAHLAHAARLGGDAALPVCAHAIERFGQNARHRGFAHAARAGEEIGMVQPLLRERIRQSLHHMLLAHHLGEALGAVFAGKDEVRHRRAAHFSLLIARHWSNLHEKSSWEIRSF